MKRLIAVALFVAGLALPMAAQRGASRGGGAARSSGAPTSGAGFSMSAPRTEFAPASHFTYSAPRAYSPLSPRVATQPAFRASSTYTNRRPIYYRPGLRQTPYSPTGYAVLPSYWPGYFGSDDYNPNLTPYVTPDSSTQPYPAYGPGYDPTYDPSYDPRQYGLPVPGSQSSPAPYPPSAPPPEADAVTLIFKDGRPAQQIHNYILSSATLYIRDGRPREIAVDDLDLPATVKANHAAGVDFNLPLPRK